MELDWYKQLSVGCGFPGYRPGFSQDQLDIGSYRLLDTSFFHRIRSCMVSVNKNQGLRLPGHWIVLNWNWILDYWIWI